MLMYADVYLAGVADGAEGGVPVSATLYCIRTHAAATSRRRDQSERSVTARVVREG